MLFWHFHNKPTAVTIAAVVDKVATETECMTPAERQTEAETNGEVIDLGEWLVEQVIGILRQTRASVLYGETDDGVALGNVQLDMLAVGVFGGIVEQLAENPHQIEAIGQNLI